MRNTYSFLSEVETEEQEGGCGSDSVCPGGSTRQSGVCRVQCSCDGRETDEEERETEEEPRRSEHVDGRLVSEEYIPHGGRGEEDTTQDVELEIGLPVLT